MTLIQFPDGAKSEAPTSETIALPWFIPTPEAIRERDRLLASRYFLVRAAGGPAGEIWRCGRCNGKHRYFTLMCREQPFSGITGGLFAYWHTVGVQGVADFLTDAQRIRLRELSKLFGPSQAAPDLATAHPQTARSIGTDERDADWGAMALGILEPITRAEAARYAERIRTAGWPSFTLPGLLPGEGV